MEENKAYSESPPPTPRVPGGRPNDEEVTAAFNFLQDNRGHLPHVKSVHYNPNTDLEAILDADATGSFYPNGVSLPGKEQYATAYSSEFDTALSNGAHKRQAEKQAASAVSGPHLVVGTVYAVSKEALHTFISLSVQKDEAAIEELYSQGKLSSPNPQNTGH